MSHLVIAGGSDAGISAALRAREIDTGMDITVIVAYRFPNFSFCGIPYYLSGDRVSKRLLGVQIIGHHGAEISKRVDIIATAIFNGMKMDEISDLDLSYTSPLSNPWDPIQMATQKWIKTI